MLKITNLTKKFKKKVIFEEINLELEFGNIYGFIGANGSGKSVFFKTICGFLKADGGTVALDGKVIGKDIDFLPELGVLIEKPGFMENYTQFQNLKYLAQINNVINDEDIRAALELVGLEPGNPEKVKNFSLGMRQRLAIAQAMMENQKIIILDEPFNGLDQQGAARIKRLLLDLKAPDRLILLTSHISGDMEELSDFIFAFRKRRFCRRNPCRFIFLKLFRSPGNLYSDRTNFANRAFDCIKCGMRGGRFWETANESDCLLESGQYFPVDKAGLL